MKKLILFASLLIATNGIADKLHHFNDIKTAAMTGKAIHITINFSKCSASNKTIPQNENVAVFTPNTIMITDRIATGFNHFTLNNPTFPGRPVYEFVRYTITDDDNVNLTSQVLDAVNYSAISDKYSFNCKLGNGAKVYD